MNVDRVVIPRLRRQFWPSLLYDSFGVTYLDLELSALVHDVYGLPARQGRKKKVHLGLAHPEHKRLDKS